VPVGGQSWGCVEGHVMELLAVKYVLPDDCGGCGVEEVTIGGIVAA